MKYPVTAKCDRHRGHGEFVDPSSSQAAIKFKLTLTNADALQNRKVGGTGGPVVTDHEIRKFGMHLQPTQTAPAFRPCSKAAVLTTATAGAVGQGGNLSPPTVVTVWETDRSKGRISGFPSGW